MKLQTWILTAEERLRAAGIESARLEAQVLAGHVLRVDRTWIVVHGDADFPELAGEGLLQRRIGGEPLAYILGWREFYGRRFSVRPGALIPRQETETVVEAALELFGGNEAVKALDVGTGSGCLAATLKLEQPGWTVAASDLSVKALEIARDNLNALKADVMTVQADACNAMSYRSLDLVVTNPPYVSPHDPLPKEITDWEPHTALFADNHGLSFYEKLALEANVVLKPGGVLVSEIGAGQLEQVTTIFQTAGWRMIKYWPDLSGIDRVIAVTPP